MNPLTDEQRLINLNNEQKLILSMAGKIFASKGGSENNAVKQAKDILAKFRSFAEIGAIAEVAAEIFASPTKSGTKQNIETAMSEAENLFNAVIHPVP